MPPVDHTRLEKTGAGYYVNNHNNQGGRSFKKLEDAKRYYRQQRDEYEVKVLKQIRD